MEAVYHRQVLQRSIGERVSARALAAILVANLGQDAPLGLLHPEYHFDSSLFGRSLAYMERCRAEAAGAERVMQAWAAFGRLSHGAADFYSHSNYVALWLGVHSHNGLPPLEWMDGLDAAVLRHPRLMSGRIYAADVLYLVPRLRPWIRTWAPRDSHAVMNLDSPAMGPLFPYSLEAAVQRTVAEFDRTLAAIGEASGEAAMKAFCDLALS
jgi:hypothetical protein